MGTVPPLLTFENDANGLERLVVEADGGVRYEILRAAHPDWQDRVGSFRTTLELGELRVAEMLARDLVAAEPKTRGRSGAIVSASIDGREATHPMEGPEGTAAELLSDLIERAREHPVAALQLRAQIVAPADVIMLLESIGSEPVMFRIEPSSLVLSGEAAAGWETVWHGPPAQSLHLVAPGVGYVGAVLAPATLDPGRTARGLLAGALAGGGAGLSRVQLGVAGVMLLPGGDPEEPFGGDDVFADPEFPTSRFRLSSPPVPVGASA